MSEKYERAEEERDPYIAILEDEETREQALQRTIKDRGWTALSFVILSLLLGAANMYQLLRPLPTPLIHNVDAQGQVVTRMLIRADEVPANDPRKQAAIRTLIMDWIQNHENRSVDREVIAGGLTTVLRTTAGPELQEIKAYLRTHNAFADPEKGAVYVKFQPGKPPRHLMGETWVADFIKVTKTKTKTTEEEWTAEIQVAQHNDWIGAYDAYGLRVINAELLPLVK